METELSVLHQKCALMDSVEEQTQTLQRELAAHRESRAQLEQQLDEQIQLASESRAEMERMREEQKKKIKDAHERQSGHRNSTDQMRLLQEARDDIVRDQEVECRLRQVKFEEMARHISSLEGEVAAGRALLDSERQHRRDVERKFEEEEVMKLHTIFGE